MTEYPEWKPIYESFQWVGDLIPEEREGRYFVKGRAIHPCKTYHPHEWPEVRVYLEEELKTSAPTLTDKPLTIDHTITLEAPNKVLKSAWEDGAVEYVAEISKDIYELAKSGEIRHVSIEYDWQVLQKLDGIAPRGLELTGLSLLRQLRPGDPTTTVEVWEGVVQKLMEQAGWTPEKEYFPLADCVRGTIRSHSQAGVMIRTCRIGEDYKVQAVLSSRKREGLSEQEGDTERLHKEQQERAKKYGIEPKPSGNLTKPSEYEKVPEDQFADPVNWRYPVDAENVKGALTYFNQPDNRRDYSHEEQVKIMAKIIGAALDNNTEVSYQPEDPVYKSLPEDLKGKLKGYERKPSESEALKAELSDAQKRIRDLTKERDGLQAKLSIGEAVVEPGTKPQFPSGYVKAVEILAILPKDVPYRWGAGPHELVRRLRRKCSQSN